MIGDVVLSLAGRDADRLFLIISAIDENYVLISDGRHHKLNKPKKKKLKHLSVIEAHPELKDRIENGITDKEIKQILQKANRGEE